MNTRTLRTLTTAVASALLAAIASATLRAQVDAAIEAAHADVGPEQHTDPIPSMEDDVRPTPEDLLADAGVATTIPAMTAVLQDRQMDSALRAASAMALARTGDHSVVPVLLATLDDPDDAMRSAALIALARLPDPRAVPRLKAILDDTSTRGSSQGDSLRGPATYALIKIRTEEAAAVVLRTVLDPQEQANMRYSALDDIDDMGMDGIARYLRPLLLESEAQLRIGAAAAMGRMGDPGAIPTLVHGIIDTGLDDYLREAALIALEHVTRQSFGRTDERGGVAGVDEYDEIARRVDAWWRSNRRYYE